MKQFSPVLVVLGLLAAVQSAVAGDPGTTRGIIDIGKPERPADAVTLVGPDGYHLIPEGQAPTKWVFADGILTASPAWDSVLTKESYRDFRMHVEFNVNEVKDAKDPEADGNSGIYLQNRYEIQILNSFGVPEADYKSSYCGSIYRRKKPDRLVCKKAGEWQSFDIVFRAARFDGGKKTVNARITVYQNGELIHDDYSIPGKTGVGEKEGPEPRPIKLQGHHNPVRFRNVWIQKLKFGVGHQEDSISLAGIWRFRLDPESIGVEKKWFAEKLDDSVTLPGTTDTNQKGVFKDERAVDRLSRVWYWKGPAWYQREVIIPESWNGKRITLLLERTKTTRVWVDDTDCGAEDTLSAPQVFDLTRALTPGRHTFTVLVDNAKLPPVGPSHAVDERTQSNWNGIVGKIELRVTDPVWIEDAQVYPDAAGKQARVRVVVGNVTGQPATGKLAVNCRSCNVATPTDFAAQSVEVQAPDARSVVEFVYQPGASAPLWDEFQPAMLRLDLRLATAAGGQSFVDQRAVRFGLRNFKRDGQHLAINSRTVFLRGRLDCANYPLTGYPPMDKDGWLRVLGILKEWGLNHVRFHSWCPPEAAFVAADELGMYFQVELPNKRSAFKAPESTDAPKRNIDYLDVPGSDPNASLYDYALREAELIFRHFGNHPSFVMFTLGNELGRNPAMYDLVARFQKRDPRHLYAQGANNMHWQPSYAEGDDFWVTGKTGKHLPVRGAFFPGDFPGGGHIDSQPPSTMVNYYDSIKDVPVPVIGHETAEFQVTPDFREIPKYTGVLKARNLEIFRQRLDDANMLDRSHDFMRASGALAAICQREDIEAALRTPGLAGFHLLDLQDFPGQGTALVGMLNVFMESKGIITPEARRQYCCETVPLLLMKKYTWTADETLDPEIKIAHYGAADIPNARVNWTLRDGECSQVATGTLGPLTIKQGGLASIGQIHVPLEKAKAPRQIKVTVAIEGTKYSNTYDIWVYPPKVDTSTPKEVLVTNRLDATTLKFLAEGGKVLLFSRTNDPKRTVGGAFATDFWCWPMFAKAAIAQKIEPAPGTQGFICDPNHPALAEFPTEFHSNWQWWHTVKNSRPIILDKTPADYRPIIHVIDNFARNHKLGLLFETKVGQGKLLVCASDLPTLQAHPEARQLMHSLLQYVDSPAFAPRAELEGELLKNLLPGNDP